MLQALRNIWDVPDLRKRVLFTLGLLAVYRIGNHVPTPGINAQSLIDFFEQNRGNWFGLVDMFSGGNLAKVTIFALGIMPYISASIILQLLTVVWPYLEKLSKEGELGRRKITQYTRYGTVLLSIVQSFTIAVYLERLTLANQFQIVDSPGWGFRLMTVLTLTTGTAFIMWLGEQITERGVGNGMSLIIFAGIVVGFPRAVLDTFQMIERGELSLLAALLLLVAMAAVVAAIVFVERGQRRIPVQYAKRMVGRRMYGGQTTHLPLRVNTAGVIPVIFASSIIAFPQTVASWLGGNNPWMQARLRAAAVGHAALQPALRRLHPVLLLLLHGDRLQPRRRGRQHAQVRRLHPRHPPRQAHLRVPRPHPRPHHLRRRHLPGAGRDPAGVPDHRASRWRRCP